MPTTIPMMMNTNGAAAMIAACCSAVRPPARSRTIAARPVSIPHTTTTPRAGSRFPREDIIPITTDAASAPLMKNSATRKMTSADVIVVSGSCSSRLKSETSGFAAASMRFAWPVSCRSIAVPPKIANHTNVTPVGTSSTPSRYSRIVRPFEIRARKVPTNGVHEIHHAQ